MTNQINIQINHTVQTNTNVVVQKQTHKDSSLIKLITKEEFRELFKHYSPQLSKNTNEYYLKNSDLFWDHLFGHISYAIYYGYNKKAAYLTEESAHKILQNFEKFVSGFDFYNRPLGFLMVKNPNTGIVDVLHYSSNLEESQKETHINYLAINLNSNKSDNNNDSKLSNPFEEDQKKWYEALKSKLILTNGQKTCTEQELLSAFINFSQTIQNMDLKFYPPNFSKEFLDKSVNPIVLLARWESVLRNRHLKIQDRETQWKVMLQLRLENGDEAIRALSDFEKDANPCGFILPEMNLIKSDFLHIRIIGKEFENHWGFRSITDPKKIENKKDFWRYIAFQPHRQSIKFYQDTLQAIEDITLVSDENKLNLIRMLAGGSTRFNAAHNLEEEQKFLDIWKDICSIINRWETMNPVANVFSGARLMSKETKRHLRNELVKHLSRLREAPNIVWLNMMFGHIKYFFSKSSSVFTPRYLLNLSNKLNDIVIDLKMAVYKGSKFLCNKGNWVEEKIKDYVELQHDLNQKAGPLHKLLGAHISTFNITNENKNEYIKNIKELKFDDQSLLIFTLKLLEDIQENLNLKSADLFEICTKIQTKELQTEINIVDYLEKKLSSNFPENYFIEKKNQILIAHKKLDAEIIAFIDKLNFTEEQSIAVKRILSEIKANISLIEVKDLQDLAIKFNDFTDIFTSSDLTKFLKELADMSRYITDLEDINELLNTLLDKRKFSDFEHIYFRNMIVKNSQDLISKFSYYIKTIDSHLTTYPNLNPNYLQNMYATYILNFYDENDINDLTTLLENLETVIKANPHIQDYIFLSLQNIPGKNTPEFNFNALSFSNTLMTINRILSENQTSNVQNMQTFYTLLAKYSKDPHACIDVFKSLEETKLDADKVKFIINTISKLLEKNESLANIQHMVKYIISLETEKYQQFVRCYTNLPYPPLETWQEWSKQPETLDQKYTDFTIKPFGERKLKYAFDLQRYHKQKSLFSGLIKNEEKFSKDIFTDTLGLTLNNTLNENRQKSIVELQKIFKETSTEKDSIKMLCAAIELLARTTSQKDLTSEAKISQEINTTQVMAIYLALNHPTGKLQIEMDTGEGKSRVLMLLAACKTNLGFTTDFSTSDIQLAERDYFTYKSFFTTLNIPTSLVTLSTPELLYQQKGVNFTDNEQLQLARNKSDIDGKPFAFINSEPKQRCLLQDEIDKFKKDKSKYSCNYASISQKFGELTWIYSHLIKFISNQDNCTSELQTRSAYNNKADVFLKYLSQNEADPTRVTLFSSLCKAYPDQLATWLHSADLAIKKMKLNDNFAITEEFFPIIDGEGHTRMSQKVLVLNNGRPAEGALFADGLHQCIIALLNIQAGKEIYVIPPEVETQRTSYPITFMSKYDDGQIIGASGTTRSNGPIEDSNINYENYGYLLIPREKSLQRENKNIWAAKDRAQQIKFIKSELLKKIASGSPALIICKDDNQSLALYNVLSKDPDLKASFTRVHSLTTSEEEKLAIQKAGISGNITFSTAGMFSRGVDIESDNLFVISAYVPTLEDEIQIMGRTGRAGKPGEYRMMPDLNDKSSQLNGRTYNIFNEVDKYQKSLALQSEFQENVSVIYALFLEEVTKSFLQTRPSHDKIELWLIKWQEFLNLMQKNWEARSEIFLDNLKKNNKELFIKELQSFMQTWSAKLKENFPETVINSQNDIEGKAYKIFDSSIHQMAFFKPQRQALKVQHRYDPSDDGQARIYDTLFAKTRACLNGERRWFADYYAWREGRGALFPNLMATLNGERMLFADLIATIKRWLNEFYEAYSVKKNADLRFNTATAS